MKWSVSIVSLGLALMFAGSEGGAAKPKAKVKPIPPAPAPVGNVKAGEAAFARRFPATCKGCHKFGDQGGAAIGADLTHVGKRLNAEKIRGWLQNPKKMDQKTIMSPVKASEKELSDLAAFLATQK